MDILAIIEKKKNGFELNREEIQFFVDGVCDGSIKDFQITSLLMAICLKDLSFDEVYNLTMCMSQSGKTLDLSNIGDCIDKHSTGGVSDTTTLIVVPVLASIGLKVAKMSGRSLGFTGGTADKMEVFDGYRTEISTDEFVRLIQKNNASIISQSGDFAVADKIIYKLRSESATVDNIGLIASSIMSKKIASGAKIVILDCKYGSGAFMKTKRDCKKLAKLMVEIGKKAGIKVCAIISSMEQPLSQFIGNNLEVYSALQVLSGCKNNLYKVACYICCVALIKSGKCQTFSEAHILVEQAIATGMAKQKLEQIVKEQGGKTEVIENPNILFPKNKSIIILAKSRGFIKSIDTEKLGNICHNLQKLNGVTVRQDDVGIILHCQLGDFVNCDDKLATIYYNNADGLSNLQTELEGAFVIGVKPKISKLIDCVIE